MTDTNNDHTELLVIGGGPGGYPAAIRAAQRGVDVTLVEKDDFGGVCLNHGCIPSKTLISAAKKADEAASAEQMGIDATVSTDLERMVNWKNDVVTRLTDGVEQLCRMNGVSLVTGRAEFTDENTVQIHGSGDLDHLEFDNAIIATGSKPISLPGFEYDGEHILSSRGALSLSELPDELIVIGAGYIGMELSSVFARLGSAVTVVEMLDSVLPEYEQDITSIVRKRAEEHGIEFNFGEAAQEWSDTGDGIRVVTETEDGDESEYTGDKALVSIGREPVTGTMGLSTTSVDVNDRGFIETDKREKTSVDNIYAVGDVAGQPMLAHAATKEGIIAAETIAGEGYELDDWIVPAAVFTDPQIATVGMTESQAEEVGFDLQVGRMPFSSSGRAMTMNETEGFVRLIAASDGVLLGAQIVGPEASELIAELTVAINNRLSLENIANTIHVHPTLSEVVMEAAEHAMGQAIHTSN